MMLFSHHLCNSYMTIQTEDALKTTGYLVPHMEDVQRFLGVKSFVLHKNNVPTHHHLNSKIS